jgi:ribosomal protein S27E
MKENEEKDKKFWVNESKFLQCECGNWMHEQYTFSGSEGENMCPICEHAWVSDMLRMYKKLLKELCDPSMSSEDLKNRIKKGVSELLMISPQDFDGIGLEVSDYM